MGIGTLNWWRARAELVAHSTLNWWRLYKEQEGTRLFQESFSRLFSRFQEGRF
jgi:hypothetical protein